MTSLLQFESLYINILCVCGLFLKLCKIGHDLPTENFHNNRAFGVKYNLKISFYIVSI